MSRKQFWEEWVSPRLLPSLITCMVTSAAWLIAFGRGTEAAAAFNVAEHKRLESRMEVRDAVVDAEMRALKDGIDRITRSLEKNTEALERLRDDIQKGQRR